MAERCDAVVIGAGVVGLAVARSLARAGREVLVLERHEVVGAETSSRNSEVIHAGIYYPTRSLKATLCVRGKQLLYAHCAAYRVPHKRLGKIIVATSKTQFDTLAGYQRQARANGIGELPWLSRAQVLALEPEVDAQAGLFSESTGIVDSHAFMLSLVGDIEAGGGMIAFRTGVSDLERHQAGIRVRCGDFNLDAELVVNSAGLSAPALAARLGGRRQGYYAKGRYYVLSGKSPFRHLVYPVAEAGGLGVHVTLDMAGQARFGPDVVWQQDAACDFAGADSDGADFDGAGFDNADFDGADFDSADFERFAAAIRGYYPGLDASRMRPGYAGVRPKLAPAGAPFADFVIEGPAAVGVPGLVNLLGIESPGLTASLAIAERVLELIEAPSVG